MFKSSLLNPLTHGFLTRNGGVSQSPFNSMNFVVEKGDDIENVRQNRMLALEKLGLQDKELLTVNQVHGTEVVIATESWGFNEGKTPNADAIVTKNPNFVIGVFTADCVPILMHDPVNKIIAAVHSGWKGTKQNIVAHTVGAMVELGSEPANIKAAVGPCIQQDDYEVSADVFTEFFSASFTNVKFFKESANPGKYMLDLPGAVMEQLRAAGVGGVDMMELSTYQMEDQFFSCRRSFHYGESTFGCMLSAISLA